MQVEGRVEHIEPAVDLDQAVDRSAVDLDAAAAADEDHDGRAVGAGGLHGRAQGARRQLAGEFLADEPQRLDAADLELAQHAEELVCVLHRPPRLAQAFDVDFRIGTPNGFRGDRIRRARRDGESARHFGTMARDQGIERRPVGLVCGVDLVHRLAPAVEELQAEPLALLDGLAHGKAMLPASQEQAQVDVWPQHEAVRAGHLHVLEAAMALVHAMLVARQAYDAADRRHLRQDRPPVGGKRRRRGADAPVPNAEGHQLGLADAQRRRGIADAQPGLLAAQAAPASRKVGIGGREHGILLCLIYSRR